MADVIGFLREDATFGESIKPIRDRMRGLDVRIQPIATLDRLRKQGTITDAEFETLKARIVEGK